MLDDTVRPTTTQTSNVTPRELGLVAASLVAVVVVALVAVDGGILFTRPFWVDEMHTVLIAGRPSPATVISDLAAGADFGPPLVPLAAWTMRALLGGLTPVVVRTTSLVCVLAALLLTYLVLRRQFQPFASLAGILGAGSQGLVIAHSYEWRFYGPWLLCVAFFAWALTTPHRRIRLAVSAVLLCTVHWYGVITLGLMLAAVALLSRRGARALVGDFWPAVAGLIALAVCVPLAVGQRNALTVPTWVAPFDASQLTALLGRFFVTAAGLLSAIGIVAGNLDHLRKKGTSAIAEVFGPLTSPGIAALSGLLVLPLALAILSLAGQPSMLPRYALPTALALAPLLAIALSSFGIQYLEIVAAFMLAAYWLTGYGFEARSKRVFATGVKQVSASVARAASLGGPVVFSSMHVLYSVAGTVPKARDSLTFLVADDAVAPRLTKGAQVERDVVRIHNRRYGFPRIVTQSALQSTPRFSIVGFEPVLADKPGDLIAYAQTLFPNHCRDTGNSGVTAFILKGPLAKC